MCSWSRLGADRDDDPPANQECCALSLQSVSFIGQMRCCDVEMLRQKNRSIHQRQQTEDLTAYCVNSSPSVDPCCRGSAAAGVRLRPGGCGETLEPASRGHLFLDIAFR